MKSLSIIRLYICVSVAAVLAAAAFYAAYRAAGWLPSEMEWWRIEPRNIGPWALSWHSLVIQSYVLVTLLIVVTGIARLPFKGLKDFGKFMAFAFFQHVFSYGALLSLLWTVEKF